MKHTAIPDSRAPSSVIWSLAKPLAQHYQNQTLYADYHHAVYDFSKNCYQIRRNGYIQCDKILNLFALKQWTTLTEVSDIEVSVAYMGGAARLFIFGHNGSNCRLISASTLDASKTFNIANVALPSGARDELVYVRIEADENIEVFDVSFATRQRPRSDVCLGIVITTFNRPDDVETQVEILESLAFGEMAYSVIVIDNGSNLDLSRAYARTRVLQSPNLGGAGGFTRGLIELKESGGFTHAMFMDDDAFCHPEAIRRAVALIRFGMSSKLALSGAMNYLHAPEVQYELGGRVADYGVRSIRMNENTNNPRSARENQTAVTPEYGAWWCFIFPLESAEVLPFPFFVRGDDIAFSLQNEFKLETMPGLLAWQPSFEYKVAASIEYLAHRSFLTLPFLVRGKWKRRAVINGVRHAFELEVDGLRYPIAEGICNALEDVLTGPDFWSNTANTIARLQELSALEKAASVRSFLPNWIFKDRDSERLRSMRILRSRFGHLNIPARLCWRRPILTNDMMPKRGQAAFRRGIIYHAPDHSRSISCSRDWRWRRRLERRFEALVTEYDRRYDELSTSYNASHDTLQTLGAWKARFSGMGTEVKVANSSL